MRRLTSIMVLFAFWLLITGSIKPLDLGMGVVVSALVGWWADRVLWPGDPEPLPLRTWTRVPLYMAYLLKEIVVAALYVAERVLDPKLRIAPTMHTHRVHFESDTARVAFANSITLTPGTLTVDVDGDTYIIHCLHESFSDTISSGDLERRVARTFDG
ncbi:MAG: Na+/H+ antiporter subunit E [Coriobacteriia bacterium]|nr:Na+/H+ antiporter subunit E [Coriobacteriia bacterium]